MAGLRGDYDPQVTAAQKHTRQVQLERAQARETIEALESRNAALKRLLSGMGTQAVPTHKLLAELPVCALEDGSTQSVCVWDGRKQGNGVGAIVVNLDHGRFSFYPQTNGWVVSK